MSAMTGATSSNMGNQLRGAGSSQQGYNPSFSVGKSQSGYKPTQLQQFSPEQLQLFQQMFGHVGQDSFLSKLAGGDQSTFQQMEAPALRQFQGLQGNIASRFSGMGSGARNSSGFQNTMNQASSDFAQDLQSNRMNLQRQAIQDLMGMSNSLLAQKPYENSLIKKDPSFLNQLLMGTLSSAGNIGGSMAGSWAMGKGMRE